ncbi:TPA: hypothetical protein DCQ22_00005, partial [Candidatus Nomurabacteria bacterium]|nr:hypothetical protein [Candidatus Nomurabacteria bacterium]
MSKIIQEVSLEELISFIHKRNRKLQAVLLQKAEEFLGNSSPEYFELRKIILDETSGTFRSIVREIFGDVEMLV